jgi:hypothetical protein
MLRRLPIVFVLTVLGYRASAQRPVDAPRVRDEPLDRKEQPCGAGDPGHQWWEAVLPRSSG